MHFWASGVSPGLGICSCLGLGRGTWDEVWVVWVVD